MSEASALQTSNLEFETLFRNRLLEENTAEDVDIVLEDLVESMLKERIKRNQLGA